MASISADSFSKRASGEAQDYSRKRRTRAFFISPSMTMAGQPSVMKQSRQNARHVICPLPRKMAFAIRLALGEFK